LKGQNWGFPPLIPETLRRHGYSYFIESLRHHLQYASLLRIDHAMGLHRLFWIPEGLEAKDGIYVRYPAEELYAILSLESHRYSTTIVGEDLGTVPRCVRAAMSQHNLQRMYVVQYEVSAERPTALATPPANSLASVNTHDMPTFASFWEGQDIDLLRELGFFNQSEAENNRESRTALKKVLIEFLRQEGWLKEPNAKYPDIFKAALSFLAAGPAAYVLVNLEDLWQGMEPQNVPGTSNEHPNWRRKMRHSLEEFTGMPGVIALLQQIDHLRKPRDANKARLIRQRNSNR
jgi:4-alpha-glucanotransferase